MKKLRLFMSVAMAASALAMTSTASAATPQAVAPAVKATSTGPSISVVGGTRISNLGQQTITIKGTGFTNVANGTRPPLAGQPAGVYVVYGRFADNWKPSTGAGSSTRPVSTAPAVLGWALPTSLSASTRAAVAASNMGPVADLDANGNFTIQMKVSEFTTAGTGNVGLYVYAGAGAINAAHELFLPLVFAHPHNPTVGMKVTPKAMVEAAGVSVSKNAKVSTVVRGTNNVCSVLKGARRIYMAKTGKCYITVTVKTRSRTTIQRITLNVTAK